ncbi:MAG: hypothetical protein ACI90V_004267 [Bacillariaceae sp.]|jgi:hypothetical protein
MLDFYIFVLVVQLACTKRYNFESRYLKARSVALLVVEFLNVSHYLAYALHRIGLDSTRLMK